MDDGGEVKQFNVYLPVELIKRVKHQAVDAEQSLSSFVAAALEEHLAEKGRTTDMATNGIEAVFLETHNWGKAAKFLQSLGYELEFETDHNSGELRNGDGPSVFVAEVPADQPTGMRLVLEVPDAEAFEAEAAVEVVSGFEPTHWGTQEMTIRDPDGRLWSLQAPATPVAS
jgi:uncharacterized glyoxalase superfamily protein PhnB